MRVQNQDTNYGKDIFLRTIYPVVGLIRKKGGGFTDLSS